MTATRHLYRAWTVLAVLTVVSVAVRLMGAAEGVGVVANLVALAAAFIKARQVLDHFLGLRGAAGGWRTMLSAMLLLILAGVGVMTLA